MASKGSGAPPYRTIQGAAVETESWVMDPDTEREGPLPSNLPDWDYQMGLSIRRFLKLDREAIALSTGLQPSTPLAVSVRWSATPSYLRGSAAWVPLHPDQRDVTLSAEIPGERLGGRLEVQTLIVLAASGELKPATAHRPGSCLWSDSHEVWLQGSAPLFPTAVVPFSRAGLPVGAAWFVELGHDFDSAAMGSIQLLLNEEHAAVRDAVRRQRSPQDVDRVVLSALRSDVVRHMLEYALADEDFTMSSEFARESLGSVMQGLIRTYLQPHSDDQGLNEIRRMRETDASMFGAMVQSSTDFLAEER